MSSSNLDTLKARDFALAALPSTSPPAPWTKIATVPVGGLTEIGFAESSDLLLVLSYSGRAVFDCSNGGKLARDDNTELDTGNLNTEGIGPIAGIKIHMAGMHGGGLAKTTADGWGIELRPLAWPNDELILSPPGETMLWTPKGQKMNVSKLANFVSEVRAFGFSPTGKTLVVGTASDLLFIGR